jgi:PAS domain S-box-containing protein
MTSPEDHELDEDGLASAIIRTAPVVVLVLSLDGCIDYANPFFEELTGYRLDEVRGKEWFATFIPERDHELVRQIFRTSIEGAQVHSHINPIITSSGEEREIEWHAHVLRTKERGLICIGADVTEHMIADDALRRSESLLREAQSLAEMGSWELNLRSGELTWSDEVYRIFGIDPEQFGASYDAFLAAIHPDDRTAVDDAYRRSLETREPYEIEHRLLATDGQVKYVRERGVSEFDAGGNPLRSMGTVQDITAEHQADAELRAQAAVITSMTEAVLFIDASSAIRFANPAALTMWGYTTAELIGKPVMMLNALPEDENTALTAAIMSDVQSRGSYQGEMRNRRKDGSIFHTNARITQLEHPGEVLYVSVQKDITEQKRTEEQLRASLQEKEILLREVHHRVKNNLQIISSLLYFQAKRLREPEHQQVFEEGRRRVMAMQLVHEKLYQGETLSRIDLADYVRSLVRSLTSFSESGERITIVVRSEPIELPIESALPCGMVLCELITNILKYAYPSPSIGDATVRIEKAKDRVMISVQDHGVGFPEGFEPTAVSSFGWQLVCRLVAQLDGEVRVENDDGAHVLMSFPLSGGH